jgi:hypothetical protein
VEDQARLLAAPAMEADDGEIVDEFWPAQAAAAVGVCSTEETGLAEVVDPETGEVSEPPESATVALQIPMDKVSVKAFELEPEEAAKRIEQGVQKPSVGAVVTPLKNNDAMRQLNPALRSVVLQLVPAPKEVLELEGVA